MIHINHLTPKDFREGSLRTVFPELYALEKVIENTESGMHKNQSVFEHSILVFEALKSSLKSMRLTPARQKKILNVLAEGVQNYDNWELLLYAALLHDIGKKDVMRKEGRFTFANGHEEKSAQMLLKFKYRFGFGAQDMKYLQRIVKHHGDTYELIRAISTDEKNWEQYWRPFKRHFRRHTYGLLLFGYADLLGSSLKKTHPAEFVKRSLWFKRLLGIGGY